MEPIFLKPVFHHRIWGGRKLETIFNYNIPDGQIGECWAISAHKHGVCVVDGGKYDGYKLDDLYNNERALFGNAQNETFPLLVKILDASQWLSVQVHPDDKYALAHEHELGKTECWYILESGENSEIIYGHNARNKDELAKLINEKNFAALFKKIKVKKGDFFYVPAGTIHAIGEDIVILEVQQSSDTTYRIYDFDRVDQHGNKRELHLPQTLDVTVVPAISPTNNFDVKNIAGSKITTLTDNEFFNVQKLDIKGDVALTKDLASYLLLSVVAGFGKLILDNKSFNLHKGQHFIMPSGIDNYVLSGDLEIITSKNNL